MDRLDGVAAGLFCEGRYPVKHVRLNPADSLLLYSDGVTEAQDEEGNAYEEEGLVRSSCGHAGRDAPPIADGVARDLARFCGENRQQDDITLLIVRRRVG
jgi:sigma-B regulation protein RsbU (phosphoserine phosphatase)